jgi:hypothetical protein
MPSEHDMHRNKPFIAKDTVTAQGLLVDVMGHHRETLICIALNMAADTDMVMVMTTTGGAVVVDVGVGVA